MKKNVMMRVASIMLVLVLMTSSVISGTFAKYVTSGQASDNARVAKFGVHVAGSTDMFRDSYKDTYTTYTPDEKTEEITVQANSADTDVIAPGTKGTLSKFDIDGMPEVDTLVTYTATFELGEYWVVDGDEYCPIVITILYNGNTETYGMNGSAAIHKYATVADFEAGVIAAINACAKRYHTNEDLSAAENDFVISWEWPFSTSDANDIKDTKLGNAAAGANAATIELTVTCTITQVD